MNQTEVVRLTREYVDSQFPKVCSTCRKRFETLADYLRGTRHVGAPVSYDDLTGDQVPDEPLGILSFANCACGTTLVISSAGMSRALWLRLMLWSISESARRGISWGALLSEIRAEIDAQALGASSLP